MLPAPLAQGFWVRILFGGRNVYFAYFYFCVVQFRDTVGGRPPVKLDIQVRCRVPDPEGQCGQQQTWKANRQRSNKESKRTLECLSKHVATNLHLLGKACRMDAIGFERALLNYAFHWRQTDCYLQRHDWKKWLGTTCLAPFFVESRSLLRQAQLFSLLGLPTYKPSVRPIRLSDKPPVSSCTSSMKVETRAIYGTSKVLKQTINVLEP
jgi:hypothetical protein